VWYWQELQERHLHLTHDEEAQAFYTPDGELALRREGVDLRHLFTSICAISLSQALASHRR